MKSEVKIEGNRLQVTRVFDAPRHLVFGAWKDPVLLRQWWGCKDTTKVECEMDFRVGGSLSYKMNITGAGEFSYTGQYDEIVEPEKIAYHWGFGAATMRVSVEFIEQGGRTKLILTQEGFPDQSMCQFVSQGTDEAFDKLDRLLVCQEA